MNESITDPEKVTTLVLADDHTIVRDALKTLLESTNRYKVVGEASNAEEAIAITEKLAPDFLLLDVGLPQSNGYEVLYALQRKQLPTKSVMLTMYEDEKKILQAFSAGACGYLIKSAKAKEFFSALEQVAGGDIYIPEKYHHLMPQVQETLAHRERKDTAEFGDPLGNLSKREREVFYLLADGAPNRVIAKKLFVSPRTVETHRSRVLKKLALKSTADIIRYAIKNNMLSA